MLQKLCSLHGLQGQKVFADAIINFLIPFKYISDKNPYDQLFINEVVKIFTFQFGESVTKFYVVKDIWILMKCFEDVDKYHKIFLASMIIFFTSINFSGGRKKLKNGHFWPPLHKSKLIFNVHAMDIQNFFEFTNLNSR